jgi:hypothetical protein
MTTEEAVMLKEEMLNFFLEEMGGFHSCVMLPCDRPPELCHQFPRLNSINAVFRDLHTALLPDVPVCQPGQRILERSRTAANGTLTLLVHPWNCAESNKPTHGNRVGHGSRGYHIDPSVMKAYVAYIRNYVAHWFCLF